MQSHCTQVDEDIAQTSKLLFPLLQTQRGAKFVSETDTEVIVKLCKYIFDNSSAKPTFPEVSDFLAPRACFLLAAPDRGTKLAFSSSWLGYFLESWWCIKALL